MMTGGSERKIEYIKREEIETEGNEQKIRKEWTSVDNEVKGLK